MSVIEQLRRPVVARINEFNEMSTRVLGWYIEDAIRNNQKTLPVLIDSYGGEVYSLFAMIDLLKNSGLDIITIANGKAMSCGAFLLSVGSKRYCTENTTIMIHSVSGGVVGKTAELQNQANHASQINQKAFDLLDKNSNKLNGFYQNLLKQNNNADLFLTAQQALDYGLITNIGVPNVQDIFGDIGQYLSTDELFSKDYQNINDLKIFLQYGIEKNTSNADIPKGGNDSMDLNAILAKFSMSEGEKNVILGIQNELLSAKNEVSALKSKLETHQEETKKLKNEFSAQILAFNKKEDELFISSLIKDKKISNAEKEHQLKLLQALPLDLKEAHKKNLEAKANLVEGEIPDNGESAFNFSAGSTIKAKLEIIAKENNLNLSKVEDLQKAQEILVLKGSK